VDSRRTRVEARSNRTREDSRHTVQDSRIACLASELYPFSEREGLAVVHVLVPSIPQKFLKIASFGFPLGQHGREHEGLSA
jgi:hypothetical protein